ncbi:hypothetical protein D3C76_1401550 [compost metagenome]
MSSRQILGAPFHLSQALFQAPGPRGTFFNPFFYGGQTGLQLSDSVLQLACTFSQLARACRRFLQLRFVFGQ